MAMTVAGYLLSRLREWGVEHVFAYPGRRHQRHPRRVGTRPTTTRRSSRPGTRRWRRSRRSATPSSRGRRCGVCMATSGPGRHPPAERPLRRQARPRAGRRDRRADRAQSRWAAPTSRRSTCSRCSRTWPSDYVADGHRARAAAQRPRPGHPDRAGRAAPTAIIIPADVQELEYTAADPRVQDGALEPGRSTWPPVTPDDAGVRRAADVLNAGARSPSSSARAPAAPRAELERGRRPARRRRRQGAARQGRAVRRPALRHRLHRPARHPPELRDDDGTATPCSPSARASPTPSSCPTFGPGPRGPDRHRRRP